MNFYMIDEEQLTMLRQVAKRLYTEMRMNGDEMRDAAHNIMCVVNVAKEFPYEPKP